MVLASMFAEVDEDADGEINEEELKLLRKWQKTNVEWTSLNADFNVAFNLLTPTVMARLIWTLCEWLSSRKRQRKEK